MVVLPEPEAPTMPAWWPAGMERERPRRTGAVGRVG